MGPKEFTVQLDGESVGKDHPSRQPTSLYSLIRLMQIYIPV